MNTAEQSASIDEIVNQAEKLPKEKAKRSISWEMTHFRDLLGFGGMKDFLIMTAGALLITIGIYFFKFPNNFSIGGVSGLSVIFAQFIGPVSPGNIVMILNILLLIVGYAIFGKSFGFRTAYVSLLTSALVQFLEWIYPLTEPLTNQPTLELMFAVILPGLGSALLFYIGASSGGTDVIAMVLRKYTSLDIGRSLLISDIIITVLAFSYGVETGLFSIMGLFLKTTVIDFIIEGLKTHKSFSIVTTHPVQICSFIMNTLHRGATISTARGAYTNEERFLILTIMSRREAVLLQRFVQEEDPHAFISITNTSSIIGKGFRGEF